MVSQGHKSILLPKQAHPSVLAFHQNRQILAITVNDNNSISLYDKNFNSHSQLPISNPLIKNIKSINWRPNSGHCLAVASETGVGIWDIGFSDSNKKPTTKNYLGETELITMPNLKNSTNFLRLISVEGFTNVSCIEWSPCGTYLALSSTTTSTIIIYNVILEQPTPLNRGAFTSSTNSLSWSPDGHTLVQTAGKWLLCWNTENWECVIRVLDSACDKVSWIPNSNGIFLFNTKGTIKGIQCIHNGETLSLKILPQFPKIIPSITTLNIDPSGKFIVFTTPEDELSVFRIQMMANASVPKFEPLGQVIGPIDNQGVQEKRMKADRIVFANKFDRGALLTVCWGGVVVSFCELLY